MAPNEDLLAKLRAEYGYEATSVVAETVDFMVDLISVDRETGELMKAGILRMAEVVNEMLPSLYSKRRTRVYSYRDLNGVMDPIPEAVQNHFVMLIGTLLLNSIDGPHDAALHLCEGVDDLLTLWQSD